MKFVQVLKAILLSNNARLRTTHRCAMLLIFQLLAGISSYSLKLFEPNPDVQLPVAIIVVQSIVNNYFVILHYFYCY